MKARQSYSRPSALFAGAGARLTLAILLLATAFVNVPTAHASTTWTVTKTADTNDGVCNGDCSLREAIAAAVSGDTIVFSPGVTGAIMLNSGFGVLNTNGKNLTIAGPGPSLLAIDGQNATQVFYVNGLSSTVTISGFTIQHGRSSIGGGILATSANLVLSNAAVNDNASTGDGAGIYVDANSTAVLVDVTVNHNIAGGSSGGIQSNKSIRLTRVTMSNNTANGNSTGALYTLGNAVLTNVTISGNTASAGPGGGIRNSGQMTMTNVSLVGNSASTGGGNLYNGGTATITNSIIAPSLLETDCGGMGTIVNGGNNIDSGTSCGFGTSSGSMSGTDPVIGPLANNGGPTQTRAILGNSPAINAGNPTVCAAAVGLAPYGGAGGVDQRGYSRRSGFCDIGAYEAQPATVNIVMGSAPQSAVINTAFAVPLRVNVADGAAPRNVLGGVVVTYTVPATGASAILSSNTSTTDASGNAGVTATANGTAGMYSVTAIAAWASPANFDLTNSQAETKTKITSHMPNPSRPGQAVVFTFTVTSTNGTPTGSVLVGDSTDHCIGSVAAGTCSVVFTSPGMKIVAAGYSGNGDFATSMSASVSHTVLDWAVDLPLIKR